MEITIPTRPRTAKIGYINPGAHSDVRTNEVAIAGLKPELIQMPMLNPRAADVSLIFGGNRSTSQVQNGPA